jgi:hypothetical protein
MSDSSTSAPRNLHAFGLTGWIVIVGLALAWEGLGLAFGREGWPSMSDLFRAVSRPVAGRWILLALWLWLGWHFFVRGWHPLLRGAAPTTGLTTAAMSAAQLLRQVVVPLLLTFAAFATALFVTTRRGARDCTDATTVPTSVAGALRRVSATVTAAYAGFLLLVVGYYALVAGQTPAFLRAAVSGGAFIAFAVALPGLLLLSGAEALRRRRRAPRAAT